MRKGQGGSNSVTDLRPQCQSEGLQGQCGAYAGWRGLPSWPARCAAPSHGNTADATGSCHILTSRPPHCSHTALRKHARSAECHRSSKRSQSARRACFPCSGAGLQHQQVIPCPHVQVLHCSIRRQASLYGLEQACTYTPLREIQAVLTKLGQSRDLRLQQVWFMVQGVTHLPCQWQ